MSDPGGDRTKAVLLNNNGTEVTSYSPNSLHWIVDEFGHEYIQRWKYVRQEHTHLGPCLTPSEIAQREREAIEPLMAAIQFALREGMLGYHTSHWDRQGTSGANCPACAANHAAQRRLQDALDVARRRAKETQTP